MLALFDFIVGSHVAAGTDIPLDLSSVTVNGQPFDPIAEAGGMTDAAPPAPIPVVMTVTAPDTAPAVPTTASLTRAAQARLLGGEAA